MIFNCDSYKTPENKKRLFIDKLFLNSRFYFYLQYYRILLEAKKKANAGKFHDEEYCEVADNTFRLIENCGGKFNISGLDNISKVDGPVVFICNHMSILETFILPAFILPKKKASFIVKKSLVTGKFFGKIMRATKPIAVTRKDPKRDYKKVMTEGCKLLKSGRSIIVFPQGVRGKFIPEDFNSIGDKLAQKANVPVVPVALKTDFWSTGFIFWNFGPVLRKRKIYFEFGEPLGPEIDRKKRHEIVLSFIDSRLKKWMEI